MKKRLFFCILVAMLWINGVNIQAQEFPAGMFTREEEVYITQKKTLKAVILDHWLPISAKDGEPGRYRGFAVDILARLEEKTGLKIEYIVADSYQEAVELTRAGEADLMASMVGFLYFEDKGGLMASEPYLEPQMMMLHSKQTKTGGQTEYRMAEVGGYPVFSKNARLSHLAYATPEECILAVRSGQADYTYCDIFTGMIYLRKYENRDLTGFPIAARMQFGFGISPSEEAVLTGIVNQVIQGMSRDEINKSLRYNQAAHSYELWDFIYAHPFEIICIFLTAGFLMVLAYVTYVRIRSRQSISQHGYVESYTMLADTFGEAGINYNYIEDRMTILGKNADRLSLPFEIENFTTYLENSRKEISLTPKQFKELLKEGMEGTSCTAELECRLRSGKWEHFKLIYSVMTTDESYQRPISMVGCLVNTEADYLERERLTQLGRIDNLTGLLNRAGAEEEIRERLESGEAVSEDMLLIIDVDFFKKFNDSFGHICGDDVLMQVGHKIKQIFSGHDVLCRWGGDEFLLYLRNVAGQPGLTEKKCATLQKAMKKYQYEGKEIPVTLSIGGAVPGAGASLERTFERADAALYMVKKRGRNDVEILNNPGEVPLDEEI